MEREEATTSRGLYGGERGAGGKFRKPPLRKPPTTPYERPPSQTQTRTETSQRSDGGGWLSKLVDPATRFLSGGATRLLPSFFSKTVFGSDADHSEANHEVDDEGLEQQSNIEISRSTGGGEGPAEADRTDSDSDVNERLEDKSSDGSSFSEIEQMLKGKTISRHELKRLTELLHSRIADRPDVVEQSQTNPNMTTGEEVTGGSLAQENLRAPLEQNREAYSERVTGVRLQSSMRDQVGASPIDIAKAYMGARTSESGLGSQSAILTDERTPLPIDGLSSKSFIPSPSPKSSICWPGAMVQDQRAYQTPQTQRARIGLHNMPRTPYSRPAHTRSTSKLQDGGNRSFNISPSQWKQSSHTPNFGYSQVTKKRSPDAGFGSVGPVRRLRHKHVETTPFRANSSRSSISGLNRMESSDASKGFLPINNQNLEPGATTNGNINFQTVNSKPSSSSFGLSTVHPQSTEMARRILEHLDRTVPTPQKKAAELKLVTSWRKSSSEITTGTPNGNFNEHHMEGSNLRRSSSTIQQFTAKGKEVAGSSMHKAQPEQRKINEATDAVKENALAPNKVSSVNGFGCDGVGFNARPSMDFKKTQTSQVNAHEVTGGQADYAHSEKNQPLPIHNHKAAGSEALHVQKKPPPHTFGSKPALTSIAITKPDPKRIVSFDNGSGFTFPVSASSGTLSEPSTPSVMPSSSTSGLSRPQEKPTAPTNNFGSTAVEPSYTFGSTKTNGALVFVFPSTSSSTPTDGSSPKFNIGSDKKARLSFSTAVDAADADLKRVTPSELTASSKAVSIMNGCLNCAQDPELTPI